VQRQIEAQWQLQRVIDAAAIQPGFVSAYLDRDQLTILTSSDTNQMSEAIQAVLPPVGSAVIQSAPYAYDQLLGIRQAIERDMELGSLQGVLIDSVSIDARLGLVSVGVATDIERGKEILGALYGGALIVTQSLPAELLCQSRDDCGTMGGLSANGGNNAQCTTGFFVRKNFSGTIYMLTAGHCVSQSGGVNNGVSWRNPSNTVTWGDNAAMVFASQSAIDSGYFRLPALPADRNQFFASASNDTRSIAGPIYEGGLPVGKYVCRSGRISGWDCGNVTAVNQTRSFAGGGTVSGLGEVGMFSQGGDSGGGFVASDSGGNTYAAGTVVGGTVSPCLNCMTYFSTIQDIEQILAVRVCRNDACS